MTKVAEKPKVKSIKPGNSGKQQSPNTPFSIDRLYSIAYFDRNLKRLSSKLARESARLFNDATFQPNCSISLLISLSIKLLISQPFD